MHVRTLQPFRGRIDGRLVRLEPGDIVPPQLRDRALAAGWGEKVKADRPAGKQAVAEESN